MRPHVNLTAALLAVLAAVLIVGAALLLAKAMRRRSFETAGDRATYLTLHTASLAAVHLQEGLTPDAAKRSARHLRTLLGTCAVALCDTTTLLAWEGQGNHHQRDVWRHAAPVLASGRTVVLDQDDIACDDPNCPVRAAVLAPVVSDQHVVGAFAAYAAAVSPGLTRATEEVAGWVSTQVDLAELGRERTRTMEAELRALRAQINPHFIYNSLAAIASFVRTDPDRARELLLEFADFTRYALRRSGAFTPLADELRNIERYLVLEKARFGDRIQVSLLVAPEVLAVAVPYLSIQPLVENAVRHGLEGREGVGHIALNASDLGDVAEIVIEDDGVGSEPEAVRAMLAGSDPDHVGLGNVDARLRQAFGDTYGLVVETAPGAGTRVSFRVPKYAPSVRSKP